MREHASDFVDKKVRAPCCRIDARANEYIYVPICAATVQPVLSVNPARPAPVQVMMPGLQIDDVWPYR